MVVDAESRISVCPVVWQTILAVEKAAQAEVDKTPMLADVLAVLQIMRRGGAFLFSVAAQIPPTANQQQQLQLQARAQQQRQGCARPAACAGGGQARPRGSRG